MRNGLVITSEAALAAWPKANAATSEAENTAIGTDACTQLISDATRQSCSVYVQFTAYYED